MTSFSRALLIATVLLAGCVVTVNDRVIVGKNRVAAWEGKLVIAHRGASGYLPEHTLAAKAMAYAQGADYIEQDLVMTADDEIIVLHDHYLDTVSNVREVFPDRARPDGRFYVIDFTLPEIRQLAVSERFSVSDGIKTAVFKDRFPLERSSFRINTLAEEIELVQGLNKSTGKSVGIYPEIKSPAFHRTEGKDISAAVLRILKSYGYDNTEDDVFLQCFDAEELLRIHAELLPEAGMTLRLVQLLGTAADYRAALTPAGMSRIASYADGIGPSIHMIVAAESPSSDLQISELVERAHDMDLVVHPYTFRRDEMPGYARDFNELLKIFLDDIGVDGVFTDFPDLTVEYIESNL